jgi:hypothetical protein
MSFIHGKLDPAAAAVVAAVEAALFGAAIAAALVLWPNSSHSGWELILAIAATAAVFITFGLLLILGVQFFFFRPPPPQPEPKKEKSFFERVDRDTFKKLTGQDNDANLTLKEVPPWPINRPKETQALQSSLWRSISPRLDRWV